MNKVLRSRHHLLICVLLAVVTLGVYWQSLGSGFIHNMDDGVYITQNPHVQAGLTVKGIIWSFTSSHAANWHPLTWMSHMLDCRIWGLNPMGHHLTSLLFHILNTLLLFYILCLMTGYTYRSAFVAVLFAIHPLHVESVAWVAERKDVLSTFFMMLSILAYLFYTRRPGIRRYILVLFLYILGLMSKPMLVTLPLLLLLLDHWPLERKLGWKARLWEKVPLVAIAALSSLATVIAQKGGGAVPTLDDLSLASRISNALVAYWRYIGKTLSPLDLSAFYPFPAAGLPSWQVVASGLMLLITTLLVVRQRRRYPYLLMGWLWYVLTLVPVIGLVQVGAQSMADRYTYIPLIGIFIITAWGVPEVVLWGEKALPSVRVFRPGYLTLLAGVMVVGFTTLTWFQVGYWRNSITLFEHAVNVTEPKYSYRAHYALAAALAADDRNDEAIEHYDEALKLRPYSAEAHNGLGILLAIGGDIKQAVVHFQEAIRLDPRAGEPHYYMATVYYSLGDFERAWQEIRLSLDLGYQPKPAFLEALATAMPEPS